LQGLRFKGMRQLTVTHIAKLADHFNVSPALFIRP
jgi:antitoxin component HigA of HigAB toxin-antitoxin module